MKTLTAVICVLTGVFLLTVAPYAQAETEAPMKTLKLVIFSHQDFTYAADYFFLDSTGATVQVRCSRNILPFSRETISVRVNPEAGGKYDAKMEYDNGKCISYMAMVSTFLTTPAREAFEVEMSQPGKNGYQKLRISSETWTNLIK
jgi:hypothetical protein